MSKELKSKLSDVLNYSKEDYEVVKWFVDEMLDAFNPVDIEDIINTDVSEVKRKFYEKLEEKIYTSTVCCCFKVNNFHKQVIIDNPHLFNIEQFNLPIYIKEKMMHNNLNILDVEKNYNLLFDIPYHLYMDLDRITFTHIIKLGPKNFLRIIKYHKDFYRRIPVGIDFNFFVDIFWHLKVSEEDFEKIFCEAINIYASHKYYNSTRDMINFLELFPSVNIDFKSRVASIEDLENLKYNTIVADQQQYIAIKGLGLDHIIKFEKEYHFFFGEDGIKMNILGKIGEQIFGSCIDYTFSSKLWVKHNYNNYQNLLASYLNGLRIKNKKNYNLYPLLDNIEGEFRDNHPELFISKNAPVLLKSSFYFQGLRLQDLYKHFEYIPYLKDKKSDDIFKNFPFVAFEFEEYKSNYFGYYEKKFGTEALLEKVCNYGNLMTLLSSVTFINTDNKEIADCELRKCIYRDILYSRVFINPDEFLKNKTEETKIFINTYSDIFLSRDELHMDEADKEKIINDFYNSKIEFNYIQKYPNLKKDLEDKNLESIFYECSGYGKNLLYKKGYFCGIDNSDFLSLCEIYGNILVYGILDECYITIKYESFEQLTHIIDKRIVDAIYNGRIKRYNEKVPSHFKNKYPNIFYDGGAPSLDDAILLQTKFYSGMDFESFHKNWIPFLKDKDLIPSFNLFYHNLTQIKYFFDTLGNELALKLGTSNPETFKKMLDSNNLELMIEWYKKTNYKFVPDCCIMQTFNVNEADKFLLFKRKWSKLMANSNFNRTQESKSGLIKLAYTMGVFDGDDAGFNELYSMLNDLPSVITHSDRDKFNESYMADFDLLSKFHKLYILNNEGNYELNKSINRRKQDTELLRQSFYNNSCSVLLTPDKLHVIFGSFEMKYDPDFKQFLLDHWIELMNDQDYLQYYIVGIQSHFAEIKALNSNRVLTLSLAINYVKYIKYKNIELGNELVARICSIAGYSEEKFNKLQDIYNYSKQRIYNSIPRINNKTDKYQYEILKLIDPLGLAIGTLTNCCQEIDNEAEMCMQHSMTSPDGRVFVIKDFQDNIVAQSWVWRNGDVICFDNIEIPNKAFKRYAKQYGKNKEKDFAKEIFDTYKRASLELIKKDHQMYNNLLKKDIISKNQYDTYCLKKVTVGLGYNDIADAIKKNAQCDEHTIHPIDYKLPVKLNHSLYISDSDTQYILESIDAPLSLNGDCLPIYFDDYDIYDKNSFTDVQFNILNKFLLDKNNEELNIVRDNNFMEEVQDYYNSFSSDLKILMHPNFIIIYAENKDNIHIYDLIYNEKIAYNISNILEEQIFLAFKQIKNHKQIIYNQKDNKIYQKIMKLRGDYRAKD